MGKGRSGNRTTALLFVIAIAVTLYAHFVESRRQVWSGAAEAFGNVEPADIVAFEIVHGLSADEAAAGASARKISLERSGEYDWNITEPVKFRGFVPRIQGVLWEIADMVKVVEVPEGSEDAGKWCDKAGPWVSVNFKTRQGEEHLIEVGRQHPGLKEDIFARLDRKTIIVARSTARTAFSASLEELRSKALVPVAPADCIAFEVSGSQKARKAFRREEKTRRWRFAAGAPLGGLLADRVKTDALLSELNAWKIRQFVLPQEVTDEVLTKYGLDKPRLKLEVEHRRGDRISLELGASFEEGEERFVWLRAGDGGFVFSGVEGPAKRLLEEAQKYQTAKVFDFEGVEFSEVRCRGPGGSFVIRKASSDSPGVEGKGHVVETGNKDDSFRGDRLVVPEALAELRDLLVEKFYEPASVAGDPAAPALGEITVETGTGELHTLRLLRRSSDPRDAEIDAFVAERSGDRSRFLIISKWPGRLEFGPAVFRERAISELEPGNAAELVLTRGKTSWVLAYLAGSWSFSSDQLVVAGKELDEALVNKVIGGLQRDRFRVVSFAPGLAKEAWEGAGIGTHDFHLRLNLRSFFGDHKGFRKITIGKGQQIAGEAGFHYGRVDSFPSPFVLQSGFPALVEKLAAHLSEITGEP